MYFTIVRIEYHWLMGCYRHINKIYKEEHRSHNTALWDSLQYNFGIEFIFRLHLYCNFEFMNVGQSSPTFWYHLIVLCYSVYHTNKVCQVNSAIYVVKRFCHIHIQSKYSGWWLTGSLLNLGWCHITLHWNFIRKINIVMYLKVRLVLDGRPVCQLRFDELVQALLGQLVQKLVWVIWAPSR